MRYTYEYKLKCVKEYQNGVYPKTPKGVSTYGFRSRVRKWSRACDALGTDALKHKAHNNFYSPNQKFALVSQVLDGKSLLSAALCSGVDEMSLSLWMKKYSELGYNGLINKNKHEEKLMKKHKNIKTESEHEELIRLREENEYLKTEIAFIKKLDALRREKRAAQLEAKKQQQSNSSDKKDTN